MMKSSCAWRTGWRIPVAARWIGLAVVLCLEVWLLFDHEMGGSAVASRYVPREIALRGSGIEVFAPDSSVVVPRAVIVFFGNDVGFWGPHRRLAAGLARDGYAVVGIDIRPLLSVLPENRDARQVALAARIQTIIGSACSEFNGDRRACAQRTAVPSPHDALAPLLLAGHSLGAELALWAAANVDLPALSGVVAISPGSRSHLRISASDLLMTVEPTGPNSFAVDELVRRTVASRPAARIAVVRGAHDPLRSADPALIAAGGESARRFEVPLAGHSMKRLALAGLVVRRALDWVLDGSPRQIERGPRSASF